MSIISIKQSIMVQPAQETPLKSLHLSKLDMIVRTPYSHTNIFYIYHPPPKNSTRFDAEILKNALSKILVPFYPMAGRLKMNVDNNRYEIDCNAKGALFVEAETDCTLDEFGNFEPSARLRELMIPECDYTGELSSIPLLMVQVTWFRCGGLALGFAPHHHVADGITHITFFKDLLRLARGYELVIFPVHDRVYVRPREPARIEFQHAHEFEPIIPFLRTKRLSGESDTMQSVFKISKELILTLRQAISSSQPLKYKEKKTSTYSMVAAHVWRSTCKARNLSFDQEVKLYIPLDGRSRLKNPAIPQGYCGNLLFFSVCNAKAGDIIHQPIWYVANKVEEAIQKMDSEEYLRSSIDFLESKYGLPDPLMGAHKIMYPNLLINSWARLPYHEADFGWGPPKVFGNCEIKLEGLSFLMGSPTNGDGSLLLAINLFANHMPIFQKHLYNFNLVKSKM